MPDLPDCPDAVRFDDRRFQSAWSGALAVITVAAHPALVIAITNSVRTPCGHMQRDTPWPASRTTAPAAAKAVPEPDAAHRGPEQPGRAGCLRQQDTGTDLEAGLIPVTVPGLLRLLRDTVVPSAPPRPGPPAVLAGLAAPPPAPRPPSPPALERLCRCNTVIITNYSRRNQAVTLSRLPRRN
jgi:hypothetical protein